MSGVTAGDLDVSDGDVSGGEFGDDFLGFIEELLNRQSSDAPQTTIPEFADTSELTEIVRVYAEYDMIQTEIQTQSLQAIAVFLLLMLSGAVLYFVYRFLKSTIF